MGKVEFMDSSEPLIPNNFASYNPGFHPIEGGELTKEIYITSMVSEECLFNIHSYLQYCSKVSYLEESEKVLSAILYVRNTDNFFEYQGTGYFEKKKQKVIDEILEDILDSQRLDSVYEPIDTIKKIVNQTKADKSILNTSYQWIDAEDVWHADEAVTNLLLIGIKQVALFRGFQYVANAILKNKISSIFDNSVSDTIEQIYETWMFSESGLKVYAAMNEIKVNASGDIYL